MYLASIGALLVTKPLHTSSAASGGLRNASLLSAFALMLAFAFGVSGSTLSFATATQQLLCSADDNSLLGNAPSSHDPVIVAPVAQQASLVWLPASGCHECFQSTLLSSVRAFAARAPPALTA